MNSEEAGFSQRINRLHLFANLSTPFAGYFADSRIFFDSLRRQTFANSIFPRYPFSFFTFFLDSCVFQISRKIEIANKARIEAYPCEYCQISPTSTSLFVQVKGTIGGIASQRPIYIRQPLVELFLRGT